MPNDVVLVIGAGGIGCAIARRQGFGKIVLLADFNEKTLSTAADNLGSGPINSLNWARRCDSQGYRWR